MRMRTLLAAAFAASAVLGSLAITATPPVAEAAGTAPVCPFANSNLRYCNRVVNPAGKRGSIGLVGDSVLLGSANGASNPGLPTMLSQQGWSQVSLVATVGMRTDSSTNNPGGDHWIRQWTNAGFRPDVIAVNLGVNQLGVCTPTNTVPCENKIRTLLTQALVAVGPTGAVWWAKIQQRSYPSGLPSAGMLGWNLALDRVAASQPRLVLWNWPANTSGIRLDLGGVHPVSGVEYVKRSTRMSADITARMPAARQGVDVALPAAAASSAYQPMDESLVYDTRPAGVAPHRANETRAIDVSTTTPGATVVALSVTVTNANYAGFLRVYACGSSVPSTSSINFAPGVPASAQVLSQVGADGTVCVGNGTAGAPVDPTKTLDLVVSVEGWFGPTASNGFNPIAPLRVYEPRTGTPLRPPEPTARPFDIVVTLPTAPADATAVAVILTATAATGASTVTAHRCGSPPPASPDVSVPIGGTLAGASYVPVVAGTPATICIHIEAPVTPPVVIVDVMGWFRPGVGLEFVPTTPTRLIDTRPSTRAGAWWPNLGPGQVIDFAAGVTGASAVSGSIITVRPTRSNYLTAYNCASQPPVASVLNAPAGAVAANNITVGLSATRRLCIRSQSFSNVVFDLVGYWVVPQ
jgi:hypothetical protein